MRKAPIANICVVVRLNNEVLTRVRFDGCCRVRPQAA